MTLSKNLIKYGKYAGAAITIGTVLSFLYNVNAWSADVKSLEKTQAVAIYEMDIRQINRQRKVWSTKPSRNSIEQQYINTIIKDLEDEKDTIQLKINDINRGN